MSSPHTFASRQTSAKVILTLVISALAACSTTPEQPVPTSPQPAPDVTRPMAAAGNGLSAADLAALHDPANPLSKRSIYFDLDSSAIRPEFLPVVETHGRFLSGKPRTTVTVQGNTDERGSREYNLALGQRRAEAVRLALRSQGVRDEQIDTVSYGNEKPRAEGHDEAAWSKNRRADIVYSGE